MLGLDPIRANIKQRTGRPLPFCHDRAWPGYPRSSRVWNRKTWVTGPGPVMTKWRKPTRFYLILAPMGPDPSIGRRTKVGNCEASNNVRGASDARPRIRSGEEHDGAGRPGPK